MRRIDKAFLGTSILGACAVGIALIPSGTHAVVVLKGDGKMSHLAIEGIDDHYNWTKNAWTKKPRQNYRSTFE